MSPRRKDPFIPGPEAKPYSKKAVNRAGKLLGEFFYTPVPDGKGPFGDFDADSVIEAMFAVTWWKQQHAVPLSRVAAGLRYHVAKENGQVNDRIDVAQRLKKRDTIINKMRRHKTMQLTTMHDIGGARATLPSVDHVYSVSRRLKKTWTITKTRDYIAEPKPTGYRAIHHEVKRDGVVIEVQLRSMLQHAWANQVEDDGRALGTGYKFGFGIDDVHAYYETMGRVFAVLDRGEKIPDDLQDELRSRYAKIEHILPRGKK